MRDALLRDLADLGLYVITTTYDVRIGATKLALNNIEVAAGQFANVFESLIKQTDYVWLIAPESNGILTYLTRRSLVYKKNVIGCNSIGIINRTASKYATFIALKKANIPTIDTFCYENIYKINEIDLSNGVILKPDDGVGCKNLLYLSKVEFLERADIYFGMTRGNMIMQPYVIGLPASMSLLCKNGQVWLLSANQQIIQHDNQSLKFQGCILNGMVQYWEMFEGVALQIVKVFPQLRGYVGVDLIVNESDNTVLVVEINPRLTTSYVGLHEAMNYNPAKLIIDCLFNDDFVMPVIERRYVEVRL